MKTLNNNKEFKILTLCKNKEFANINHMAEELKVTTRSVRTYIKQLNENLGEDIAQIIYVKGYGYKLEIKNKEAFELLFEENNPIARPPKNNTATNAPAMIKGIFECFFSGGCV